jgi:hypothetical protein
MTDAPDKYRAILIHPERQTFTELKIGRDIKRIRQLLQCQSFALSGAFLSGNLRDGFEAIYVSDDYLEDRDPQFWFQVDADRGSAVVIPHRRVWLGAWRRPGGRGL